MRQVEGPGQLCLELRSALRLQDWRDVLRSIVTVALLACLPCALASHALFAKCYKPRRKPKNILEQRKLRKLLRYPERPILTKRRSACDRTRSAAGEHVGQNKYSEEKRQDFGQGVHRGEGSELLHASGNTEPLGKPTGVRFVAAALPQNVCGSYGTPVLSCHIPQIYIKMSFFTGLHVT